jgi:hypothetical protein
MAKRVGSARGGIMGQMMLHRVTATWPSREG